MKRRLPHSCSSPGPYPTGNPTTATSAAPHAPPYHNGRVHLPATRREMARAPTQYPAPSPPTATCTPTTAGSAASPQTPWWATSSWAWWQPWASRWARVYYHMARGTCLAVRTRVNGKGSRRPARADTPMGSGKPCTAGGGLTGVVQSRKSSARCAYPRLLALSLPTTYGL